MSKTPQGSRGAGFGLDAELARKQAEKYDYGAEKLAIDWIEAVTGEKLEGPFGAALKNGQVLCKLINAIKPSSVKKIETSIMPFKQMENISNFLRACRAIGVREYELFETVDLYEEKDLGVVIVCLHALSRTAQASVPTFRGPYINHATGMLSSSAPVHGVAAGVGSISLGGTAPVAQAAAAPPPPRPTPVSAAPTYNAVAAADSASPPPKPPKPSNSTTTATTASATATASSSEGSAGYGSRGAGFGLDAELARKQAAKYDVGMEGEAKQWIEAVTGEAWGNVSFAERLKDGMLLCKLINTIKPGSVKKVNKASMPFMQMENISAFLRACRAIGVSEHDLFETVDLYEEKDLNVVVQCIFALGRTVQVRVPEYTGPVLGPRMASGNRREFSEDQLAKSRQESGMTKIMAGSVTTMNRSEVSVSNSVTFGAEKAGTGDNRSISAVSQGSSRVMDRTHISTANSVTFGHDMSKPNLLPQFLSKGSKLGW